MADEPIIEATFSVLATMCKYNSLRFDEDRIAHSTCRHKANVPNGCSWGSWGDCSLEKCPFIVKKEDNDG